MQRKEWGGCGVHLQVFVLCCNRERRQVRPPWYEVCLLASPFLAEADEGVPSDPCALEVSDTLDLVGMEPKSKLPVGSLPG